METTRKGVLTEIEVPESLEGLPDNRLRILRDRLIAAGLRRGGIDLRLERVVRAFQEAKAKRPKGAGREA